MRLPFALIALAIFTYIELGAATALKAPFNSAPQDWEFWSPRSEIEPDSSYDADVGRLKNGSLQIQTNENPGSFGAWKTTARNLQAGEVYRFQAWYRTTGIDNEERSVIARLNWRQSNGKMARPPDFIAGSQKEGEWTLVDYVTRAPENADRLEIQLGMGFDANANVWWDDVSLEREKATKSRKARVATIHHKVKGSKSAQENRDIFLELVDQAATRDPDIICLPEGITVVGNPLDYSEVSESIPGPSTRQLGAAAKRHNTYIVAGIYEREGDLIYNTAVLLDRNGELAGTYRKTHLPREEWEGGLAPGDSYPVFQTDFGKIGLMICWDVHFPEPSRAMALQGADLLLLPIWGGNELLTRARAIENHVYLVSSSYGMRSFIVDPLGEVVTEAFQDDPIAIAEIDFEKQYFQEWLGNMKHRFWKERRPDIPIE